MKGPVLRKIVIVLLAALGVFAVNGAARAEDAIRLAEASERGTFNLGTARATVDRVFDGTLDRHVLKLEYAAPRGTSVGVWLKGLPEGLTSKRADVAHVGVKTEAAGTNAPQAVLEIKGSAGTQRVPLGVQDEKWSVTETALDWPAIGSVNEVVVAVSPGGDSEVAGTLYLDIGLERLPLLRQLSMSPAARIGATALTALLAAVLAAVLHALARVFRSAPQAPQAQVARSAYSLLWRDFVLGAGVVLIAGLAITVYTLGELGPLTLGWTALAVAVAGGAVAEWLKYGLTGRHLTAAEVFQNVLATGLLAASSSSLVVLQSPGSWPDVLLLSRTVAAAAVLLYHAVNAGCLASSGRHLGATAGAMMVGAPYVVGSLLLLTAGGLLQAIGQALTGGTLAVSPEVLRTLGAALVVLVFNEAVANGLSLATKRKLLASARSHLAMLAVAAAVVVAPWVAGWGSSATVAAWPAGVRVLATVLATMLSQAGLWAEVYLITGMLMDALHGKAPSQGAAFGHPFVGMKKGMIYSGLFMGILNGLDLLWRSPGAAEFVTSHPLIVAALFGAAVFPLAKTILESFDGTQPFFLRLRKSYRDPVLFARGAVAGLGLAWAVDLALAEKAMGTRVEFGFAVGVAAFAGVSLLRDSLLAVRRRARVCWRVYFIEAILGGLIGAAIGFYLDANQVAVVIAKFHRYLSIGHAPELYGVYPFLSKWGFINLGTYTGGAGLLFAEALAGVISWSIPAWLFALNRTFMTAYFRKEAAPIKALFSRDGFAALMQNMLEVLRWGLWMSPIINSFLRPMADPTWYNQDGAIRTLVAVFRDATMSPEAFRDWSLHIFIYLLAYDAVRVLIWLDHMGLRVATLVNLSFLGMDRLDERLARWLGPAATAQFIPESVKRFATWAPLLIPFYIPRGQDWDHAWSQSQAMIAAQGPGPIAAIVAMPLMGVLLLAAGAVVAATLIVSAVRWLRSRKQSRLQRTWILANTEYEVIVKANGEVHSRTLEKDYDVTRRSYDFMDPAGRALFVVDGDAKHSSTHAWPVLGNFPSDRGPAVRIEQSGEILILTSEHGGLRTKVAISLPCADDPAELWTITVENLTDASRELKLVPYLEWVLNRPDADRGHTQYNRLFAEMQYRGELNALLAWDKHSKAMGVLAADVTPQGVLTSRMDFIGRARSLWSPRVLETLAFSPAHDADAHPTFDPIGSLLLGLHLAPKATGQVRLLMGQAKNNKQAASLVERHLFGRTPHSVDDETGGAKDACGDWKRKTSHAIGHGEIPPGTPQPYSEFMDGGRTLLVHTPFTPRPYDHAMSNRLGHVVAVTNRGLHTTSSGNSQQNRLTPDWPDTVTRELPGEAIYLYDPDHQQWYSPTYHPLNDPDARHEVEFSVDGTATYRMRQGAVATELTVFVPPEEPTGVYLLTVRNLADGPRRFHLAPYFQMVLANQPEAAGPLKVRYDKELNALFFENPRNNYRTGPAFVAMSHAAERVETRRGRFFGAGRGVARPFMVEHGEPDTTSSEDDRPIAGLLATLDVPAHSERTVAILLGQADDWQQAEAVIRKYQDPAAACESLRQTRNWWLAMMDTVRVKTVDRSFDHYLHWLKYQALAERMWARRGFYQASGAYGFRDQLQDSVNLIWMDPALARRQILLHASQQFIEGDVVHWFHLLQDGRTGFAARTHASDNLLWLAWALAEYVTATGDDSLLDERTPYLVAQQPFEPLPAGKHGMGFVPHRSSRTDTVYRHAMRAIDLVLNRRMGRHGLPLIGTGDWNDGLDEIGSQGRGESVWLGFFLYYILDRMVGIIGHKDGHGRKARYIERARRLKEALESTWRGDRYLRAIHDDGTEIGVEGSGVWEIDALTASWAVMSGINPQRGRQVFDTALRVLEKGNTVLLGWPALREDTKPYLGRSSWYPEGVRENGMYCHGVQWLVGAARLLSKQCERGGDLEAARAYRETAYRLWLKISPIPHVTANEIETYGGQPNKQAADMLTAFDPGRMIWHGYTGAAGWLFRQALEGVLGAELVCGEMSPPDDLADAIGPWHGARLSRDTEGSPLACWASAARRHAGPGSQTHQRLQPKPMEECRETAPSGPLDE